MCIERYSTGHLIQCAVERHFIPIYTMALKFPVGKRFGLPIIHSHSSTPKKLQSQSKIKTKVLKGKTTSGSAIHRIISSSLFAESDGLVWLQSTLATAFLKPPRHYRHNLSPRHAGSRKDVMKYFLNQAWSEDRLLQPSTFTVSAWWSVPAIAIPCILVHHEKVEEHKEHAKAKPDLAVFQLLNGHLMQIMNLPGAQLVVWLQNATGCSWTHETSYQLPNHGFHV